MKNIILHQLARAAERRLAEHRPTVVAVTGSVGKTSTRLAIAAVLDGSFHVRTPEKNYNNEFGVPLTILGEHSAGKSPWGWLRLFWRVYTRDVAYPNMLVLEYGADKPGDIRALCAIARPDVSVITTVSPVHVANYPDFAALTREKQSLGEETSGEGVVVLNADDPLVANMASVMRVPVLTYSLVKNADVRVSNIRTHVATPAQFRPNEVYATISARITTHEGEAELQLRDCLGMGVVSACAAAVAVAGHFGIPVTTAVARLNERMAPAPGRLHPLPGIRTSLILDDTYNAAPASMRSGVAALAQFGTTAPGRRIAVLGKMAELGTFATEEHARLGAYVAENAEVFIAVGEEMRGAAAAAIAAGMPQHAVLWYATPDAAGAYLAAHIVPGDVVLVKGSQSARMEKAVKAVLAEPARAKELLVRQDEYWLRR